MHADSNLHATYDDYDDSVVAQKETKKFGESLFGEFKSQGKRIGLWFALKSVISGDYDEIPKRYESELATKIKKYIQFLEDKSKT